MTEAACDSKPITEEGDNIDDQVCIKQPFMKSILTPTGDTQGRVYCLQLYGDFNCNNLETSKKVDFSVDEGMCMTLVDVDRPDSPDNVLFASYRWVRSCTGNVSLRDRTHTVPSISPRSGLIVIVS
jgi:hypothetical protein